MSTLISPYTSEHELLPSSSNPRVFDLYHALYHCKWSVGHRNLRTTEDQHTNVFICSKILFHCHWTTWYPTSSIYNCGLLLMSSLTFIYCHGPVHFSFKPHLPRVKGLVFQSRKVSCSRFLFNHTSWLTFDFSFTLLSKWDRLTWSSG